MSTVSWKILALGHAVAALQIHPRGNDELSVESGFVNVGIRSLSKKRNLRPIGFDQLAESGVSELKKKKLESDPKDDENLEKELELDAEVLRQLQSDIATLTNFQIELDDEAVALKRYVEWKTKDLATAAEELREFAKAKLPSLHFHFDAKNDNLAQNPKFSRKVEELKEIKAKISELQQTGKAEEKIQLTDSRTILIGDELRFAKSRGLEQNFHNNFNVGDTVKVIARKGNGLIRVQFPNENAEDFPETYFQ